MIYRWTNQQLSIGNVLPSAFDGEAGGKLLVEVYAPFYKSPGPSIYFSV